MSTGRLSEHLPTSYVFGGLVVSVCGVFGNLSNDVIQVYLLTFMRSFSYFERCVSSLSLTHTHISGKCFSTSKNQNSDL